jgi:signal transduction histidine kinase
MHELLPEDPMNTVCESHQEGTTAKWKSHSAHELFPQGIHDLTDTSFEILHAHTGADRRSCAPVDIAAAIIHELSQPLAAIAANAQAAGHYLSVEKTDLEALRGTIQSILRDSIDASQTIQNIRTLFREASGTGGAPVDLPSVIKEVLLRLDSKMRQHAIKIHLSIDASVRPVAGNRLQLRQVLTNLMTNAVESMEHNCEWPRDLEIKVSRWGRMVLTEIADRGDGVTDCEKIFNAFFTTKKTGMGMGLRICRTIIEAYQGRLWASARADRGAVFTFTLPLAGGLS